MKWPILIRQVVGRSMEPTIMPKQFIAASGWIKPKQGSIVVAKAEKREIIKRITSIDGLKITVEGDNKSHSKSYVISKRQIKGVRFA